MAFAGIAGVRQRGRGAPPSTDDMLRSINGWDGTRHENLLLRMKNAVMFPGTSASVITSEIGRLRDTIISAFQWDRYQDSVRFGGGDARTASTAEADLALVQKKIDEKIALFISQVVEQVTRSTLLHLAVDQGRQLTGIVHALIVNGIDVNALNSRGETALDIARRRDHGGIVKILEADLAQRKQRDPEVRRQRALEERRRRQDRQGAGRGDRRQEEGQDNDDADLGGITIRFPRLGCSLCNASLTEETTAFACSACAAGTCQDDDELDNYDDSVACYCSEACAIADWYHNDHWRTHIAVAAAVAAAAATTATTAVVESKAASASAE